MSPPSTKRQIKQFVVRDPAQLRALTLPIRLELVDTVASLGPSSVADVARATGHKRESLYFHFKQLERVGLLLPAGERETTRRREKLYRTPGRDIVMYVDESDEANLRTHLDSARANVRQTERELQAAFAAGARTRGARRELHVARIKGWLTPAQLARANTLIDELEELVHGGERQASSKLYTLTAVLLPQPKDRQ